MSYLFCVWAATKLFGNSHIGGVPVKLTGYLRLHTSLLTHLTGSSSVLNEGEHQPLGLLLHNDLSH